ncbi:hypothetical protein AAY473_012773 [Plecturocebus cupreus]
MTKVLAACDPPAWTAPISLRPAGDVDRRLGIHHVGQSGLELLNSRAQIPTGAVVVIAPPGDGCTAADAGQRCHKALEAVNLAAVRAIGPAPVGDTGHQ